MSYYCPKDGARVPSWMPRHFPCRADVKYYIAFIGLCCVISLGFLFAPRLIPFVNSVWSNLFPQRPSIALQSKPTQSAQGTTDENDSAETQLSAPTKVGTAATQTPHPRNTEKPTVDPNLPPGMSAIPSGWYEIGSSEEEANWHLRFCNRFDNCNSIDYEDLMPRHSVFIDSFYLDVHEVTNAEYRKCVEAGECRPPNRAAIEKYFASDYAENRYYDNYPVVGVIWEDANDYCAWIGKRLPTEAEWERAARGEDGWLYPWGPGGGQASTYSVLQGSTTLTNYCDSSCPMDRWKDTSFSDGWEGPAPVKSFPSGPYGLYDMAGNVMEWVQDYYSATYYANSPENNPVNSTYSDNRVTRGGGWNNGLYHITAAYRRAAASNKPTAFLGFRCAK